MSAISQHSPRPSSATIDPILNQGTRSDLAEPKDNGGARVVEWFDKLFSSIGVMASLGAGFTFTVILAPPETLQNEDNFSRSTVSTFVAVSWLCFVLDLAVASALAQVFHFFAGEKIIPRYDKPDARTHQQLILVSSLVQGLVLAGFLFASLAVTAFSKYVGWTAVAFTGLFIILTAYCHYHQWEYAQSALSVA